MRTLWVVVFAANLANSLFMSVILFTMFFNSGSVMLFEPRGWVIALESVVSAIIVSLTVIAGVLEYGRKGRYP